MRLFGVFLLVLILISSTISGQARWHHHHQHHHHSKHNNKHVHSHKDSSISEPPQSSSSSAAYPPDDSDDEPDEPPLFSPEPSLPPVKSYVVPPIPPSESPIVPVKPPVKSYIVPPSPEHPLLPPNPPSESPIVPAKPPVKSYIVPPSPEHPLLPPNPPPEPPTVPLKPPVKSYILPPISPPIPPLESPIVPVKPPVKPYIVPPSPEPPLLPPNPPPESSIVPAKPPVKSYIAPPISPPIPPSESPIVPVKPPVKSYIEPPTEPAPEPANDEESGVLDVRKFGAVGDGKADDTDAFKLAWESACQQNDSAVILVPYGFKFMIQSTIFTGPCLGGLVLQLDGTIMPPDGPEAWPEKNSKRQWLVFYRVNEMALVGGGAIDGRGQKWWDLPCKPHKGINGTTMPGPCDSPIAIRFFMSSNLTVEGIRIKDSPQFNFRFDNCKNVHIQSIHITAPALSPNTDGIHIENTNNVEIYDSVISNGDDCVSIGSGCYDVDIRNITCGPSHGISIGSLGNHNSRACVSNITVRDSVIKSSDNGVRIKTWQGGSGAVNSITFSNIHMDNVKNPIIIDQFYCLTKECNNQTSAVLVSDILYENIKGTYNVKTPPMHFGCSDSVPCMNLTLSDVELLPAQGDLVLDPYCWNAYGEIQSLTIPPVFCLMDGAARDLLNNQLDYCSFG